MENLCIQGNLKCSNIVQKSKALFEICKSDLTLQEFKILDVYLSKINSHDSSRRSVKFSKKELESVFNVDRIRRDVLDNRLKHLQSTTFDISTDNKTIHRITLFEESYAEQDFDGSWTVTLTCTERASQYIFNIENLGYLRYKLQSVINLSSLYSYILFMFLEYNRNFYKTTIEIDFDDLKNLLNCTAKSCENYKEFNKEILKRCHKEITEKTDLKFSYESLRRGRKVAKIKFNIETVVVLGEAVPGEHTYSNDSLEFLAEACKFEFSEDEMSVLWDILARHNDKVLSMSKNDFIDISFANFNDIILARFDYLNIKYNEFKLVKNVKNRFNYFKKMIENDFLNV